MIRGKKCRKLNQFKRYWRGTINKIDSLNHQVLWHFIQKKKAWQSFWLATNIFILTDYRFAGMQINQHLFYLNWTCLRQGTAGLPAGFRSVLCAFPPRLWIKRYSYLWHAILIVFTKYKREKLIISVEWGSMRKML